MALLERSDVLLPLLVDQLRDASALRRAWALDLIRGIGTPARAAWPALVASLERSGRMEGPRAIASIGWDSREYVEELRAVLVDEERPLQARASALAAIFTLFDTWYAVSDGLETRPRILFAIELARAAVREALDEEILWAQPPVLAAIVNVSSYVPELLERLSSLCATGLASDHEEVRESAALLARYLHLNAEQEGILVKALDRARGDAVESVRVQANLALEEIAMREQVEAELRRLDAAAQDSG